MSSASRDPLHLHRIEPEANMRRFYRLSLPPTLFGEFSLVRNWGRIGSAGQDMMQTFARPEEAAQAFSSLEREKRGRGYRDAGPKAAEPK